MTAFIRSYFFGRLVDQGLANTFAVSTLRHGTNPLSWLLIHLHGAQPSWGGSSLGGDFGRRFDYQNKNNFFLWTDRDSFYAIAQSKLFSVTSCYNLLNRVCWVASPLSVLGICIPSIKFRLSPSELEKMNPDRSYREQSYACGGSVACFTNQPISPSNIGIFGTIRNGISHETPQRMSTNIYQVATGIAQLALAGCLAFSCASTLLSDIDTVTVITSIAGICLGLI